MKEDGIDRHTMLNHRVQSLHWSSKTKSWTTEIWVDGEASKTIRSKFIFLATGYYDYDEPFQAHIPGIDSFEGTVAHPQFWPEDLDYTNKNVVIVGSGATAITLLPAMAARANHITMLQRSPGYIMSVPTESTLEQFIFAMLPSYLAYKLVRLKWIIVPAIFRAYCTRFPKAARRQVLKASRVALAKCANVDLDFEPRYDPFEQRLCFCPDGDFFEALRSGKASTKTGNIEAVTAKSIRLQSGEELHPDIIVTATGLKLQLGGHIKIDIDGQPIHLNKHHVWKGLMIEGLHNFVFSFGYLDASWTLGVDVSAKLACRIITEMQKEGAQAVVPRLSVEERQNMRDERFMPLKSTYVEKALSVLPKLGESPQWQGRAPYFRELLSLKFGDTRTGVQYVR
ncbi:hypothetical protein SLS63_013119 [Diaporthe eres]|uniref:Flavin-binding monooxygenase n=1 Tax=Diaporthe eres TaxID=83184 RepID=A0ABR1NPG9_DIAER